MNFYKFILSIACFLILFNCNEEQETTFSDINVTKENNKIVEINIPKANGNIAISSKINSEIEKTVISALYIGNPNEITSSSIEESINAFNNEYNTFKAEFDKVAQNWEAQIDGEVTYKSPNITSIAITSYINTGGAHGNLHIFFLNFNSETGDKIDNKQLINDIKGLKKIAKPYFKEATKENSILLDYNEFKLPKNIGLNEIGLVLLYNSNEVESYSSDIIEFSIPFEVAESYLDFNSL